MGANGGGITIQNVNGLNPEDVAYAFQRVQAKQNALYARV